MPRDDATVELTREWLRKADEDAHAMMRLLEPPELYDVAAFHAQQAIEKALKGYLNWHGQSFRKTHNLRELVEQCAEIDGAFSRFSDSARRISAYALQARYPDIEADPDPAAVHEFADRAHEIVAFVRSRLEI